MLASENVSPAYASTQNTRVWATHLHGISAACILSVLAGTTVAQTNIAHQGNGPATMTNAAHQPTAPSTPGMASRVNEQAAPPTVTPVVPNSKGKAAKGKQQANPQDVKIAIDENNIVDLHVNDEDLSSVLEMLSIQSQRNIVASKNVAARVTANLYGVTFYEALDAILNVNGYGYIEDGNFIYVYTLQEISEIEIANQPRVSKVIPLSYLSAIDAAAFVTPLLSEKGQIKTNGKSAGFPSLGDAPQGNEEYALHSTIVVYDYEANVAEIETLLKQLDTKPSQVLVEATILQTTLNEANAFGVDFALVSNMAFGDFVSLGGPLVGPNALLGGKSGSAPLPADGGGTALSSTVGNTAGAGGVKLGIVSNDVSIFLRMLDEVTDSTVLSNPKLLALNRQGARVLVGRKVGFLNTTSTDTATTQTVEFLDTGTQLYFRPFVDPIERTIRMELKPQVSEAVIRDVKDATGASVTIPDEITNEMSTNVLVRDGQTIVLGGLFRESTKSTRRQWPLLGDIPIVGSAFRGNEDETQRSEIIFLITPTIVDDSALADAGQRGLEAVEQARAGAREGTMKWSRDRLTNQLNVEAQKLAAEGNKEKALWKIERSLSLNSSQPEIIAMREKLSGEKSNSYKRSLLDRIVDQETNPNRRNRPAPQSSLPTFSETPGTATNVTATSQVDEVGTNPQVTSAGEITQTATVGTVDEHQFNAVPAFNEVPVVSPSATQVTFATETTPTEQIASDVPESAPATSATPQVAAAEVTPAPSDAVMNGTAVPVATPPQTLAVASVPAFASEQECANAWLGSRSIFWSWRSSAQVPNISPTVTQVAPSE